LQPAVAVNTLAAKKPKDKPKNPNFGSGPTSKLPGWKLSALENGAIGRSHRSSVGLKKLKDAINHSKCVLNVSLPCALCHISLCVL
jgi:phosphoserine aminotransferase